MYPLGTTPYLTTVGYWIIALTAVCLAYALMVSWPIFRKSSHSSLFPRLRFALFGALLFTSEPVWQIFLALAGSNWMSFFHDAPFMIVRLGEMSYKVKWVPYFLMGFALFALAWPVFNWRTGKRNKCTPLGCHID